MDHFVPPDLISFSVLNRYYQYSQQIKYYTLVSNKDVTITSTKPINRSNFGMILYLYTGSLHYIAKESILKVKSIAI